MKQLIAIMLLMHSVESVAQLIDGAQLKKKRYYDSTLNRMRLRDAVSLEKELGTTDNLIDPNDELTEIISSDGGQLLTMTFHPGDVINEFSQFKVEYNSKQVKSPYSIKDKVFVTGKGIKLGVTENQVVEMLGKPLTKNPEKEFLKYSYKQQNGLYFGYYWFKNGKLYKFWFGEEYP